MTNYKIRVSFINDTGGSVISYVFPIQEDNKNKAIDLAKDAMYALIKGMNGRIVIDYAVKA